MDVCNHPNQKMESICLALAIYLVLKFKSKGALIALIAGIIYHYTGYHWAKLLDKTVIGILMIHCLRNTKWNWTPFFSILIIISSLLNNCKKNWIVHCTCIQIPMFLCWYKMLTL